MAQLKKIVKCTPEQYAQWKQAGTLDPDAIYITKVEDEGGSSTEAVIIDQPSSATTGTLSAVQLTTLQANNDNYIIFNNELFRLNDKQTASGYLVYSHVGEDSTHNFYIKCITVTISTAGWVLTSKQIQ